MESSKQLSLQIKHTKMTNITSFAKYSLGKEQSEEQEVKGHFNEVY